MAMEYRPLVAMPPALIHEVNELVASKQFQRGLREALPRYLVPRQDPRRRRAQAPLGPGGRAEGDGDGQRGRDHAPRAPHDLSGDGGHARPDDRPGGHGLRHDPLVPGHGHRRAHRRRPASLRRGSPPRSSPRWRGSRSRCRRSRCTPTSATRSRGSRWRSRSCPNRCSTAFAPGVRKPHPLAAGLAGPPAALPARRLRGSGDETSRSRGRSRRRSS